MVISKLSLLRLAGIHILLLSVFACAAEAETVAMAFAENIAPYSFANPDRGIEIDIIAESLAYRGHRLKPHFYPLARVPRAFFNEEIDAATTDLGENLTLQGAYYGDSAVVFHNALISLKDRGYVIESYADTEGLSIISFQGAAKRYPRLAQVIKKTNIFSETAQQQNQVKMLLSGRVDLVLSDVAIFQYYAKILENSDQALSRDFKVHYIFNENSMNYRPIFKDSKIRDDFNEGLKILKANGRYEAIYGHYLKAM